MTTPPPPDTDILRELAETIEAAWAEDRPIIRVPFSATAAAAAVRRARMLVAGTHPGLIVRAELARLNGGPADVILHGSTDALGHAAMRGGGDPDSDAPLWFPLIPPQILASGRLLAVTYRPVHLVSAPLLRLAPEPAPEAPGRAA